MLVRFLPLIAMLVMLALAAALALVGYLSSRRQKRGFLLLAVFAAGSSAVIVGDAWTHAATIGPVVIRAAVAIALIMDLGLLGGFAVGRYVQLRNRSAATGTALAVVLLLVGVLGYAYTLVHGLVSVAKDAGVFDTVTRYEPEKNKDCPANLKSLYEAFSLYSQDWDALPPAENWVDNEDLTSKIRQNEWLHCPAVSNRQDDKYGYSYNTQVAGRKLGGKKLAEMPDAAKTPLLYDSTTLAKNAHDAYSTLPHPGRHGGRNNVLYCDGHVEPIAP